MRTITAPTTSQPLPEQHLVLGDHGAHGSTAATTVGPPIGLGPRTCPRHRRRGWRGPPGPALGRVRATPPVVADLGGRRVAVAPTGHAGAGGAGVPGGVRQRFRDDEVGHRLDRDRRARFGRHVDGDGNGAARGDRGQRGVQTAVGEDRRVDGARQVAQLGEGGLGVLRVVGERVVRADLERLEGRVREDGVDERAAAADER